jgi:hypothetical protein
MINGNFYVRKGTLLTYSEEDLLADGNRLLSKMLEQSQQKESSKRPEPARQETPILNFESAPSEDEPEESLEEGFRIVEKENDSEEPTKKIIPLRKEPSKPIEISKTIKKVFGEDETQ